MSAVVSYNAMVEQLVTMGFPRAKAEAKAREEHGIAAIAPEQLQAQEDRLEKTIEFEGDKQLRALGFEVVRFSHPGKTKQTPGIPDRRYYHRGRGIAFWWEAKSATGRQRPEQRIFQEMCDAVGDPYVLGTDADLYDWLIARGIARREGEYLVSHNYEPERRTA